MSEKKFEPCSLQDATHVEVNKVVYQIFGNICTYNIGLRWLEEGVWIPIELFPIFGIKTFKEIKPEPIEFEATFAMYDGKWHPLHSLDDGVSYLHCKKTKFKCVQILEEKKK
jgi:hypothetical protein